ncbi:MAG TPA: BrnA antitoxin family protein [Bradyrhizobium sp.]|nr:BrnA antitoxin family protein [Bradyrhizobium sp.]
MIVSEENTKSSWVDPDDAPELDDEWFERAELRVGDKIIRRGRPAGSSKNLVSLRLDKEVIDHFRSTGPGWQTRMNDVLRKAAGL